jgi:hypothetical protein
MQGLHAGLTHMTGSTLYQMASEVVGVAFDKMMPVTEDRLLAAVLKQFCVLLVMTRPEPPPCPCREKKE